MLLSGGDPLTIGDDKLDWLLGRLRAIKHIEFIRIGTKMPTVAAPAHHQEPGRDPEEAPSALDEPALHPSQRADARGDRSDGAPGRRRHPARQPDGAAQGHQRRCRDHEAADARPAEAPRAALLPLPVRPDQRLGPFPHHCRARVWRSSRRCAATPPAMRRRSSRSMRRAAAARSSSRPILSWAATATICCSGISRGRSIAIPIPAGNWDGQQSRWRRIRGHACASASPTTSGPTISPWAMSEEDTAEFDSEVTIAAICSALSGHGPDAGPHRRREEPDRQAGQGRALRRGVQFLRRAQGYCARGAGARDPRRL